MNRRDFLKKCAVLGAGGFVLSNSTIDIHIGPKYPNIILCMCDDLGWGDTGYNGHPVLKTPNLDDMAASGIRFDRWYSGAPVCSPTRGSCITGRHPYRYGIFTANSGHMKKQEITLAEALKTQGYATGHFGKWHMGTLTTEINDSNRGRPGATEHYSPPWDNGFDVCFSTEAKVPTWDPMKNPGSDSFYGTYYWRQDGNYVAIDSPELAGDDSRVIMDQAIPFIRNAVARKKPFLAIIWFHTPHKPVVAGPEYKAMYSAHSSGEQDYYGCVTAMDEQVGRLRHGIAHSERSRRHNVVVLQRQRTGERYARSNRRLPRTQTQPLRGWRKGAGPAGMACKNKSTQSCANVLLYIGLLPHGDGGP